MRERYLYLADTPQGILMSGQVPEYQFWLLAEISPVHSEKVINAL
ncbi:TPA: AFA-III adhesin operon transcriptional regulator AfaA, partial [Escherichia coli]|nr:AFA-III adhesin operon transcriptional regulator AfaA [Escherichia coli]